MNAHGFLDCFWFSVQTMATIGYGYLAPADTLANAIVTVESFYGIALHRAGHRRVLRRFSTPRARDRVQQGRDHRRARRQALAACSAWRTSASPRSSRRPCAATSCATRSSRTASRCAGSTTSSCAARPRRSSRCRSSRSTTSTTRARCAGMTAGRCRETNVNVIVTFTGIDDSLAATVHARYLWTWNDIVFDHQFVDMLQARRERQALPRSRADPRHRATRGSPVIEYAPDAPRRAVRGQPAGVLRVRLRRVDVPRRQPRRVRALRLLARADARDVAARYPACGGYAAPRVRRRGDAVERGQLQPPRASPRPGGARCSTSISRSGA